MPWYPPSRIDEAEEALNGEHGKALMEVMRAYSVWDPTPPDTERARERGIELGWLDSSGTKLSDLGWLVASPLREFLYWEERQRRLHSGFSESSWLQADALRGKRIMEVGSGFGCNLFTISEFSASVFGVDLEPVVLQFTPILARLAGIEPPPVALAASESLPLADNSFDVVVSFGSVQYMDIRKAIKEAARTLRPGGQFIFTTSTVGQFLRRTLETKKKLLQPRFAYVKLRSLAAIMTYQYLGRRIGVRPSEEVWASQSFTERWIRQAGLTVEDVLTTPSHQVCYVAGKPA